MSGALMDSDNEVITKLRIDVERLHIIIVEHEKALKLAHQNLLVYMGMAVSITTLIVKWIR